MAEPIGHLLPIQQEDEKDDITPIPEFELGANGELKPTDTDPLDYSLEIEQEHTEVESPVFEYAYQRFEHIAGKDEEAITKKDITFLEGFIQSESYTGLYESEYSEWINELMKARTES